MQSINLIPQQEVNEQSQEKAVRVSTLVSVLLMVVTIAVAGYYFYQTQTLSEQISTLNAESDGYRQQISKLVDVEIYARNLDKKYITVKSIFTERSLFSELAKELRARTPEGVFIESITLQRDSKFNITGLADNYILIAAFTNNLLNNEFEGGDARFKKLFKTVTLNSVNLEKSRNEVSYSINVEMDGDLLKDK